MTTMRPAWLPVSVFTCPACKQEYILYTLSSSKERFALKQTNSNALLTEDIDACPSCGAEFTCDLFEEIMYAADADDAAGIPNEDL